MRENFRAVFWIAVSTAATGAMVAVVFFDWVPDQRLVNGTVWMVAGTVASMKADAAISKFLR
jgi:hypothetical protein